MERVALNALAGRSGTGDSIQRLGGKPLHLNRRGQRPQLHRTRTRPIVAHRVVGCPCGWPRRGRSEGACLDFAKRESRTGTGRPAGRNGGACCPQHAGLALGVAGLSQAVAGLAQRRRRFDPAAWGQAAPPQSPGSATPATSNPDPPDCCSSGSGLSLWLASLRPVRRCVPRFCEARISDRYRPPSRAERWSVLRSTRWLGAGCCRLGAAATAIRSSGLGASRSTCAPSDRGQRPRLHRRARSERKKIGCLV